jgi:transposase
MPPREDERHERAFAVYLSLGEKRSYKQVAAQVGVSLSTVKQWSKRYRWKERIAERDAEAARQVADNTLSNTVEEFTRNKKIVQMAMVKLAKAIADGRIKMQLGDLDRLIKLQSFLDGYQEGQTWDSLTPEALAQRFHYATKTLSEDDLKRMVAELHRLEKAGRPQVEPPG